ncbi:hypothetical protein GIB67_012942 [Kingdonia uniflora]|uniref:Sodium/calcium exchanger membrane region domain-containing protein n=1 Tax=Kingdonia uniflora TaxID=39325 RepID=A0A7J7NFT0_9MAGN|nr:hypothetical protein GIB67_012942 [Kingdonia uniflora]
MIVVIAVLSEYVVGTIEDASETWGLSVSFIGIILLPIVGNAAEHAGAVIFAFKNKLDFSLGVALAGGVAVAVFLLLLMRECCQEKFPSLGIDGAEEGGRECVEKLELEITELKGKMKLMNHIEGKYDNGVQHKMKEMHWKKRGRNG